MGAGVENQQVGGAWAEGDEVLSLSMSGTINVFDRRTADGPARVLQVRRHWHWLRTLSLSSLGRGFWYARGFGNSAPRPRAAFVSSTAPTRPFSVTPPPHPISLCALDADNTATFRSQGPSKPITAAAPLSPSNSTFVAGVGDGRVLAFSGSEYTYVEGAAHSTVVAGIAVASDGSGTVFSAGIDDRVREITPDGASFVCVCSHLKLLSFLLYVLT